jgi:hypothetical protein
MMERIERIQNIGNVTKTLLKAGVAAPKVGLERVHEVFNKWLLIKDENAITITVASAVANQLPGDPFWLFLITGPSGLKTELISSLGQLPYMHPLSDLTAQTFASGMRTKGPDPSLLPKLKPGTVLTLKDFTTVLSMHRDKRHEILSQLREIYDGSYTKSWGTGKTLKWKGKVGLISGVTTIIDTHYSIYQTLGERFVQYRIAQPDPERVAEIAMRNQGAEQEMREELSTAVKEFVDGLSLEAVPELSGETLKKLARLASFAVQARSGVIRDSYGGKEITYVPEPESPPRLAKQFALMVKSLVICGLSEDAAYGLCCKIGFDSIHRTRVAILRLLVQTAEDGGDSLTTTAVAEKTQYPTNTVRRYLQDLAALGVVQVQKGGQGIADVWRISEETLERLELSESKEVLLGVRNVSDHREKALYI